MPLDGSDASKLALPFAEELAVKLKARVTLFQMAQRGFPEMEMSTLGAREWIKMEAAEKKRARAYLVSVEKELRQKGIAVTHNVVSGLDPANEIMEVGKKVDADLVVMSTRGRSPISTWVLGSTAEKVLRQGDLPLMLVRK